ncbi:MULTISPECIES: diacylglycerol kinase family protein [unclassified Kitasatospora]|uniref:diacylglycerol/lipid kinase family protein n=1 Tax=unclassified Kitasatospora TaxID=2633591 RepID=UPI00070CA264|nr:MULTISPECIES: diacylglycerol kinase family protein [unclassified Kitasatospora]KQV24052.1 diacylglycerol kinase [Kitasatospora sp. Root107]KRB67233.1 diacylglycerol kinase [Kitasatospora sp. Root187]
MGRSVEGAMRAQRLARVAVGCAGAAVLVLVTLVGLRGIGVMIVGLIGLGVAAAGVWWALAHRGPTRVFGMVLAVAAPVWVLGFLVNSGMGVASLLAVALWTGAMTTAAGALRQDRKERTVRETPAERPNRPVLIMNPRSGGGKVEKFGLVAKAEALGARVLLLTDQDVTELARQAVRDGADLLGVAGGDGTQALVAAVAAEHRLPFLVISAGTRNHFAMDLGLDRTDPARCLDALTDGVELSVDLGSVAGRPFVNTVSFGAYAEIVQSPEYRNAKAATALGVLPDLLANRAGARLTVQADDTRLTDPQALLISNNPYETGDLLGAGSRPRLDRGRLGVVSLRVDGPAQAAELALRGEQAQGLTVLTARQVTVTADSDTVPVAVDGEALTLPTPVRCAIRPGALRVLVPRDRPGATAVAPLRDWRQVGRLALGH